MLVSALPLGVVLAEADGTIVFRNAFAQNFVNARHSEALVESALSKLLDDARGGRRLERSVDLYGPPRRNLELRSFPVLEDGNVEGLAVTIEDVTEARRIEDVRRDFIANVSHELKTPVGAIGILAETLSEADDPEVVSRLSDRLHDESHRLGQTIDDLLTLSRIESGERFEPSVVTIDSILTSAVTRVQAAADRAGVSLAREVHDDDLTIVGDERQLSSAIGNLVENAVKYSDAGSTVTLRAEQQGEWLALSVTDNGIGIPEADLDRVFERFYRVDHARRRSTGGTGLGLAIVRHVALNHAGSVDVTSVEGEGSTFTLFLHPRRADELFETNESAPSEVSIHG